MKNTITITTIVRGDLVEIEAACEVQEATATEPRKCRVVAGNALPQAMRAAPNVVGRLTAAQTEALVKAQAKRAAKRASR